MVEIESLISEYDQSDYGGLLRDFPNQVHEGVQKGRKLDLDVSGVNRILVCGMGGSGITGDLLSQFLFYRSSVPVITNRFYRVPTWVDRRTLVIVVSYSGNTEETVSACDDALQYDAHCLVVTSNGTLAERARKEELPRIRIPDNLPPRAAVAYLFLPLPFVLGGIACFDAPDESVVSRTCSHLEGMISELEPDQPGNPALELARKIKGKIPIVYGSQEVTAVLAKRFKNQINENAKVFGVYNVVPEMNHNEIMALDHLKRNPQRYAAIFLRDEGEHSRIQKRFDILHDLMDECVDSLSEIRTRGRSLLSRFLTGMLYTDFVSYYLALVNHQDPTSIGYINELKNRL